MRTAFIIIAIFAAVVLLVRFAAPPAKPTFVSGERITQNALISNIRALGKRCAVTENGLGISHSVNIRNVLDECNNRVKCNAADDWLKILCGASDAILNALSDGKKCAMYSWYCAHVGKYPRVYLFCEMLVRQSDCLLTRKLLLRCIEAFEENAPFTGAERKILCGMLKFCLIGHLRAAADVGIKRAAMYDKGISDGKGGSVDLTHIRVDDYVCGIVSGCAESERSAVVDLFEYNRVDVNAAVKSRRKFLAQLYVTVDSVLRSLSVAYECDSEIYVPTKQGKRIKRYVKVFNVLFPTLLAVYAVFTSIFASNKYVALFSVAAIITYGVMRIPVLIYSPDGGINIFAPIERLLNRFISRRNNAPALDNNRQFLSETAYFGCEPQYMESTIESCLNVCCNNRGGITINSGKNSDALYIGIESGGLTASPAECDVAIELSRATYRVCKTDIELCAQVLVPIDIKACIVKLTVINRGDTDKTVKIMSAVVRSAVEDCVTEDICGGAMANGNDCFALSVADGKYGGDLSAFCADGTLRHLRSNKPALIGVRDVHVKGFSRVCSYITVVYAQSRTEAESMFRYVSDKLFYSRASVGSAVYCELNKSRKLPAVCSEAVAMREQMLPAKYPPPKLPKRELLYNLPFGGIVESSVVITDDTYYKPIENTVTNGKFGLTLNQFGIQNIAVDGKYITQPPDMYLHMPNAFVVIGESGVLWSPTSRPCGGGQTYAVHDRGYTEYTCAYNGTVCTQKCFTAKSAVFIEVVLNNMTNAERGFDIMFSALCKSGTSVELSDNGVTADKFRFCVLGERAECAMYKEGYFIYGRVARTSGFRLGGNTPAPTLSVNKTVKPNSNVKVIFCITHCARELPNLNTVNDLFDAVKSFYGRLGRISPKTDDCILNTSYSQALYSAYTAFTSRKDMPLRDLSFVMSAVKYVDPTAVKDRIYEILSCQNYTGELGGYSDCLQFLCCVAEYSQFILDRDFWNDILPYAVIRNRAEIKDNVHNHVMRAVSYIIINPTPQPGSIIQSIWNNKNLINALRFWEDRIKDGALRSACKKRLAVAAEEYSRQVKRLVSNNFFEFKSRSEAYMCAKLLFDLDLNEKAYNIIKYNNPIERELHYGNRVNDEFDYFSDPVSSAVYYSTVTERLFGVKFRGKTVKICPHTSCVTPKIAFDLYGKTKDVHITVDDSILCGNWKMRVNRINYPADSVDLGELSDDIVFYRDGKDFQNA